jgi:zinc/manganese transport system substrate-binding protein
MEVLRARAHACARAQRTDRDSPNPARRRRARLAGALIAGLALAGCNSSGPPPVGASASAGGARFTVVAAENFWGNVAAQLAGSRAAVRSIIANPATDPHSYEPAAPDARTIAGANMLIVNGLGYDTWASRLAEASSSPARVVLDVGRTLGLSAPHNPHQWYAPASVERVIAAIASGYERIDPRDAAYFAQRERVLLRRRLSAYDALRAQIRSAYAGTPVGFSESIFEPLGEDLGLKLQTRGFARAIAEGVDVSAAD